MSQSKEVSLTDRQVNLTVAQDRLTDAAEAWLESRASGRVGIAEEDELSAALKATRNAQNAYDKTLLRSGPACRRA